MNRFNVQNLIGIFLIGIILGGGIVFMYLHVQSGESNENNNALIDFVIADWTGVELSNGFPIEAFGNDEPQKAQLPASKELPMSRLGYFPDTVRSLALKVQKEYAVPAAVTLAQWALESGFGKRNLGVSNYFGHTFDATKRFLPNAKFVVRRELVNISGVNVAGKPVKFTSYQSIAECFDVHGKYLSQSNLYRAAFFTKDAEMFARIISLYYAQDSRYALKLITIMRRYQL
jgi:flagellum-specific peptidoglycan hydrolase FlgJ